MNKNINSALWGGAIIGLTTGLIVGLTTGLFNRLMLGVLVGSGVSVIAMLSAWSNRANRS